MDTCCISMESQFRKHSVDKLETVCEMGLSSDGAHQSRIEIEETMDVGHMVESEWEESYAIDQMMPFEARGVSTRHTRKNHAFEEFVTI